MALGSPASAQEGVPSGQPMALWQVLWEAVEGQGNQVVLRFLAPGIAREDGTVAFEAAQADMDWLCDTHGRPVAGLAYGRAASLVIELLDRPVPRGVTDPAATRFFETYAIEEGACVAQSF